MKGCIIKNDEISIKDICNIIGDVDNYNWLITNIECSPSDEEIAKILRYIVEKGSITIDGISLTVAKLTDSSFAVSVIPHTGEETTLLNRNPGDIVNLENDIVGKYVERLMNFKTDDRDNKSEERNNSDSITMNFLNENGFY